MRRRRSLGQDSGLWFSHSLSLGESVKGAGAAEQGSKHRQQQYPAGEIEARTEGSRILHVVPWPCGGAGKASVAGPQRAPRPAANHGPCRAGRAAQGGAHVRVPGRARHVGDARRHGRSAAAAVARRQQEEQADGFGDEKEEEEGRRPRMEPPRLLLLRLRSLKAEAAAAWKLEPRIPPHLFALLLLGWLRQSNRYLKSCCGASGRDSLSVCLCVRSFINFDSPCT